MMTANEVRESFKKFFEGKGHKIVPSAPMVIKDDPTLMFTNAGMNQWKDIILGTKDPGKDVRRVDTHKCLRVSGKHNDLEEVGHDTYHHYVRDARQLELRRLLQGRRHRHGLGILDRDLETQP